MKMHHQHTDSFFAELIRNNPTIESHLSPNPTCMVWLKVIYGANGNNPTANREDWEPLR